MLAFFNEISRTRGAWLLLLLSVLGFELCALYFQHVMNLAPCVMCIYERVAMAGVLVAAFIGLLAPQNGLIRWVGLLGWGVSAGYGLKLSIEHVGYQFPDPSDLFGATCDIFVSFPSWAPLNKWAPWMFEANGDCGKVVWQFFDLSMPQWLVIIFAAMLIVLAIVVLSQFFGKRRERRLF
ncbi:disulfide bond formation protein B [Enterovibrio norvegicus]|uniref:Disulfide bond formation protein B n=1 Tax=Enterovibrio norvegicus DSM 15893 TaxID=1121869 RepID=A0A1I5VLK9_9GAMM|nr:disulfide bond formation protein DsbB [Enterovibrio norvegicus]MCC4797568.1 disulfide bond formation protein DsbB [Enterovibrio norvegicus]PMI33682.1 disulfide bond formation protein B [Enterovibrio norvegicus]PMI36439.1 disulfide bond formation protein B [Enterovibrio norvegicus]PMN50157.1 disulfide bond formation protein B [Enterovibrio norvegicus]TKF19341.1 disulfide bond formation protein DsbB [Enterovibrio norvegicus]